MSRRKPDLPLWSLTDAELRSREALYLRLLHGQAPSIVTDQLHRRLNEVRLAIWSR